MSPEEKAREIGQLIYVTGYDHISGRDLIAAAIREAVAAERGAVLSALGCRFRDSNNAIDNLEGVIQDLRHAGLRDRVCIETVTRVQGQIVDVVDLCKRAL